jgi:hypothetical protein
MFALYFSIFAVEGMMKKIIMAASVAAPVLVLASLAGLRAQTNPPHGTPPTCPYNDASDCLPPGLHHPQLHPDLAIVRYRA